MLNERIRRPSNRKGLGDRPRSSSRNVPFNMNEFKKLVKRYNTHPDGITGEPASSPKNYFEYASLNLEELGKGSSRIVYLLSAKKVLKIALNVKGIAQNEAEIDIYTNPKTKAIIAKIFDYDVDYKYIIH